METGTFGDRDKGHLETGTFGDNGGVQRQQGHYETRGINFGDRGIVGTGAVWVQEARWDIMKTDINFGDRGSIGTREARWDRGSWGQVHLQTRGT